MKVKLQWEAPDADDVFPLRGRLNGMSSDTRYSRIASCISEYPEQPHCRLLTGGDELREGAWNKKH